MRFGPGRMASTTGHDQPDGVDDEPEPVALEVALQRLLDVWPHDVEGRIARVNGDDLFLLSKIPQQSLLRHAPGDPGHHAVLHALRPRRRGLIFLFVAVLFGLAKQLGKAALEPRDDPG